ncbi:hypothetical protein H112_03543 [Trichophyton rubrum D6]|uniref:Uncharacterized protein n=3 Tax=Trichophyton TaxID=5550 RepID=A0A080WGZ7_TRIRC|nr:uncharacterized protein TERG_12200 [Trichophyton rubrum CBS 118892]EZF23834.1 hypothetical protein H100_03548 [Trichophyton rubrum MR850]EZF42922.1 hypothetical protein H102_03541 [Trichophyton rubrum CBS 100081]EZF53572.1 hypothetical protein H103_03552 [Trichophyton rubrum CBS 288.86]EZF64161.1 hypothetical protein H104_03538 [Trichophyton rubrum CBS 289.86]EZF74773.1 hypothetical protein H105_03565 [Trichophyton soudanense CBS 452.61]EZF85438.1 hypothetical protein H110_03549 [Trichophy
MVSATLGISGDAPNVVCWVRSTVRDIQKDSVCVVGAHMSMAADPCSERDTNDFLSLSFTKGVGNSQLSKVEWMDGCVRRCRPCYPNGCPVSSFLSRNELN